MSDRGGRKQGGVEKSRVSHIYLGTTAVGNFSSFEVRPSSATLKVSGTCGRLRHLRLGFGPVLQETRNKEWCALVTPLVSADRTAGSDPQGHNHFAQPTAGPRGHNMFHTILGCDRGRETQGRVFHTHTHTQLSW